MTDKIALLRHFLAVGGLKEKIQAVRLLIAAYRAEVEEEAYQRGVKEGIGLVYIDKGEKV